MSKLEHTKTRLFDKRALDVENIKLFPGSSRDATPEQMAEQISNAISQIEAGDYDLIETFDKDGQ